MNLKGQQTIRSAGLLIVIGQLGRLHSVDVVYEVKPLGSDPVGIPFPFLDRLADFLGIPEFLGILLQLPLVVEGKSRVKSTVRQNAPEAFPVADARVTVSGFEIGLIASDPPPVMLARFNETTILDPTVSTLDLEIEMKIEILHFQILADDEGVSLGWILLGCLTNDCTILDAPEFGISVPTL